MKIYTGSGDKGKTSLFSGERVDKFNKRVEAYGAIDELNSILGVLASYISEPNAGMISRIRTIQADLMAIGALLAATPGSRIFKSLAGIPLEKIKWLEKNIDEMNEQLSSLKGFILPGGHISASWAHVARAVCRRAERRMLGIPPGPNELSKDMENAFVYINRLSDYLFVMARYCNHITGHDDIFWEK